jgi:hypothetical protein
MRHIAIAIGLIAVGCFLVYNPYALVSREAMREMNDRYGRPSLESRKGYMRLGGVLCIAFGLFQIFRYLSS